MLAVFKYGSLALLVLLVGLISLWLNNAGKPWWYVPLVAMVGTVGVLSMLILGEANLAFQRAVGAAYGVLFRDVAFAGATFLLLSVAVVLSGWQVWRTWPALTKYFSVMVFRDLRQPGHYGAGSRVLIHTESDGSTHIETVQENGIARFNEIAEQTNVWLQIHEDRDAMEWSWSAPGFTLDSLPAQREYDLTTIADVEWKQIGELAVPPVAVPTGTSSRPKLGEQVGDSSLQSLNAPWGIPAAPTIINRYAYILGVDTDRRIPLWAAYAVATTERNVEMRREFRRDPALPTNMQSTKQDYRFAKVEQGLNFDRGHLISPQDIRYKGSLAVIEAHYYTALTPQTPALNRGIWAKLERATRALAARLERQVYVLDGPLFTDGQPTLTIGPNRIPVPTHFFRVMTWVSDEGTLKTSAYLMPNDNERRPDFQAFAVSIEEIERKSGLTLLPHLEPSATSILKAKARPLPAQ